MQRSIVLTAPGYTPLSWCSVFFLRGYPNFHMYLFHRSSLRPQTPIWSYMHGNLFDRCREYRFLLWNGHSRYTLRWTLPFYSSAAMRHQNQSATSTCHDPVRCCGIAHQRSESTIQGVRLLVNDNKIDLVVDLYTEADLGEGRVPVGWKFGLLWVKPSLPSVKVEGFFVAPERGIVAKSLLWQKGGRNRKIVL